ncbi:MAG: FAD:protein FMN transferase, partial [Rhodospirillales bacterium]|nr:FAD:protein FMN transferase [Rhodospirillales bacterium]
MVIAPKTAQFSRRRFLSITAAAAGLPLLAAANGRAEPSLLPAREMRWRGTALGAQASMTLHTINPGAAADAVRLVIDEVDRLENIFSLYRPGSELVRLNTAGRLDRPSLELVELLSLARNFSEITDGAFDVTVQPLWQLYATNAGTPPPDTIVQTLKSVGFRHVTFGPEQIILSRPGAG